ncbi:MAG: hypothetical protein U9R34_04845, partial [Nanoarchaeota archaeon]|nr:hypothetical protein [Nanoarchaeota archaeon]
NNSIFNDTYLINRTNRTLEHITIFNLTSGVTYYPRVRAWNRAELHSSWSSEVSTIIDYLGPDINIITPGDNGCNLSSLYPVIRAETNEWAICSFKDFSVPTAGFIDFDYTSSEYHESRANVNETNLYTFNITCMDAIGNSADVSRTFTADPGIAISFSSISLASQYYIGFTASIPLELNNKLGGVSYSDFAVSIDNENLSSEEFGITDLGCGNYLLEINAPSVEGEYDIEIYAGSDYETGTLNMKHLNFNITYLGTLTDDDKKDQIAYAASGNVTVGIATDSLAGDITTSNDALNLVLDPMGGSSYIFAVPSPSSLRAVDRLLEEKEFSEVINPNFGSEIEKVQYKTTLKLDYAYADIYSLMSESEEYGFEQFMPGKYSMLVKNTGTDPDTGNQKIEIIVS